MVSLRDGFYEKEADISIVVETQSNHIVKAGHRSCLVLEVALFLFMKWKERF